MAVLVESGDSVVSISAAESLKMFAFSLVWGTWVLFRNTATRVVGPLLTTGRGTDGDAAAADCKKADDNADKRLACRGRRDRPPPCLSTAVYGTHSYVKVKVIASQEDPRQYLVFYRPWPHFSRSNGIVAPSKCGPKEI